MKMTDMGHKEDMLQPEMAKGEKSKMCYPKYPYITISPSNL